MYHYLLSPSCCSKPAVCTTYITLLIPIHYMDTGYSGYSSKIHILYSMKKKFFLEQYALLL